MAVWRCREESGSGGEDAGGKVGSDGGVKTSDGVVVGEGLKVCLTGHDQVGCVGVSGGSMGEWWPMVREGQGDEVGRGGGEGMTGSGGRAARGGEGRTV